MKTQNDSRAYGFIAGAVVLILALLANACAHYPMPRDVRSVDDRAESAVEVFTECGSGSGVLVDESTVYTAFHVVECAPGQMAQVIAIRTLDKKSSVARIRVSDADRDIASLELETPMPDVTPVRVRGAVIGETICAATATPERQMRCGIVKPGDLSPRRHGDVVVGGMNVWYGNSGSGVYGTDGALVGIAVRLNWCNIADAFIFMITDERQVTCGGRVSSLYDSLVTT